MRRRISSSSVTEVKRRGRSYRCAYAKVLHIFSVSTQPFSYGLVIFDEFYRAKPLDHFESQLGFNSQPQRRAMLDGKGLSIHFVSKYCLMVFCKFQINHFVELSRGVAVAVFVSFTVGE